MTIPFAPLRCRPLSQKATVGGGTGRTRGQKGAKNGRHQQIQRRQWQALTLTTDGERGERGESGEKVYRKSEKERERERGWRKGPLERKTVTIGTVSCFVSVEVIAQHVCGDRCVYYLQVHCFDRGERERERRGRRRERGSDKWWCYAILLFLSSLRLFFFELFCLSLITTVTRRRV
jgi:hypothetical protein